MTATKEDIKNWFVEGKEQGATHLIVVCDTFSHEDYPAFVKPEENVREQYDEYNGKDMQKVNEVYSLREDMYIQLNEDRALHLPRSE